MEQLMLDLIPAGAKATCHVSQYDIGRTIRFNLTSGGTAYSLSGTETIKVYIKKPDGTTAERNIANTSSTYVDWVTGEGDCDVSGKCECELVITAGSVVIGSKNFTMKVEDDPYDGQGVVIETAGPAPIATFTTNIVDLLQSVKCGINAWSDSNVIEQEPYNFRKVAGTAPRIGNHLFDKLVGGTVAWNQLVNPAIYSTQTINDVTFTKNADGTVTVNGTASADAYLSIYNISANRPSRKYLLIGCPSGGSLSTYYIGGRFIWTTNAKTDKGGGIILNDASDLVYSDVLCIFVKSGVQVDNLTFKPNLIDLTAMFGSTIADYIYSLEQATAGAGVAWFRKLFPNSYYPYDAGSLKSVKTTAHKTTGANLYSGVSKNSQCSSTGAISLTSSSNYLGVDSIIRVIPNTQYSFALFGFTVGSFNIGSYDKNGNFIVRTGFTTNVDSANNAIYGSFTTDANTYGVFIYAYDANVPYSDISNAKLMLAFGSYFPNAYEPYTEHSYPLDDVELRGLFKLDSNNKLYADGDTYESSGDVTRKRNRKTLNGTENWYEYGSGTNRFYSFIDDMKKAGSDLNVAADIICDKYYVTAPKATAGDKTISGGDVNTNYIIIKDSQFSSVSDIQTWLTTHNIVVEYDRLTETTETADPFTNPQQVDANGTEEYIDSRTPAIPVGHETYYAQAYSECNVTANGTTHNIQFGELVVESAELDVTNGILKRHDDTTKQLTPLALEAVIGQNSVSCDTGDTEVKYLYNA